MIVTELFIYPIKGCGGISLQSAEIDEFGLKGDRRFMIVDQSGQFMSQRKHPKMSLIRTKLEGMFINVGFEGMSDLTLEPSMESNDIVVRIWDDDVTATDMGEAASLWFSEVLGQKVHLVTIGQRYSRNVRIHGSIYSSKMHFGDACPILVASQESLDDLNSRLESPITIDRFRPNMVISGAQPYDEDTWSYFRIGDQLFQFGKRCGRCTVTTINQQTGEGGKEPLKTLATYRKDDGNVYFGSYYLPVTRGFLSAGEMVTAKS